MDKAKVIEALEVGLEWMNSLMDLGCIDEVIPDIDQYDSDIALITEQIEAVKAL